MPTNGSTKTANEFQDPFGSMSKPKQLPEKPKETTAILLGEHSRYQIKSGRLSGEYVARAFPKPPTDARGLIAEARGETEEAAIAALHAVIDAREIRRAEDRRIDQSTGLAVPSLEEYAEVLSDEFELVSVRPVTLSVIPRQVRATRQERRCVSA